MNWINKLLQKKGYYLFKAQFAPKGLFLEADLFRLLKKESVQNIVDVGAFTGTMTLYFKGLFPKSTINAFEPTPQTFVQLQSTVSSLEGVHAINKGVGSRNETVLFKIFENGELNSFKTITNDEAEPLHSASVDIVTLDDYFAKKADIDILKIDVEGFELEVLKGAANLLANNKIGVILVEVGFVQDDNRHTSFFDVKHMLESVGFSFYALYDLYHYRKKTELLFANALVVNDTYLKTKGLAL